MQITLDGIKNNLGTISSIIASLAVIGGALAWWINTNYFPATRSWVIEYVTADNNEQDIPTIEVRLDQFETEIQEWTLRAINVTEERRALTEEISMLTTVIEKNIDNGNEDTPENNMLIQLRDQKIRELEETQ